MASRKFVFPLVLGISAFLVILSLFLWHRFHIVSGSKPWLPVTELKTVLAFENISAFMEDAPIGEKRDMLKNVGVLEKLNDFVHHYSKRQAWNRDESLLMSRYAHVFSDLGEFITSNPQVSTEAVWSNLEGNKIFAVQELQGVRNSLIAWDVESNEIDVLMEFENFTDLSIGQWEGTLSNDDRYIVLHGLDNGVSTILSIDLEEKTVLGRMKAKEDFNWAGVSQLGRWILVENNAREVENPQLLRYKLDLTDETVLYNKPNHGDFCLDSTGKEVYVMTGRYFEWIELDTVEKHRHGLEPDMYGHVSCRALDRPGWAYVSLLELSLIHI